MDLPMEFPEELPVGKPNQTKKEYKMKKQIGSVCFAALVVVLSVGVTIAQDKNPNGAAKKKKTARRPNPAFQPPDVKEGLPHVLLIGDSISIGYTLGVRKELDGIANVWRPKVNCGPTTKGVAELDQWLGDRKWDVIHFNFGLHDLKYMGKNGQNLADPQSPDSHQQVAIDDYQANIKKIATRLKQAGKKVIWRETTPVPDGAKGRVPGDSAKYNAAAAKAIEEVGGIAVDPMFEFATSIQSKQLPANVHYRPEGSAALAKHVAQLIKEHLQ